MGEREENLIETVTADNKKANTVVYTVAEEWLNRITHVIGGAISITGAVFLLMKVFSSQINGVQKAVCVLFAFSMIAFFVFSVIHHFQPVGERRLLFRKISRCASSAFAVCSFLPLLYFTVFPVSVPWAISLTAVTTVLAITGGAINAIDVNKYKMHCLVVYIVMALAFVIRVDLLASNKYAFILYLSGTATYALGVVFYRLTKIKGHHALWHALATISSALHYLAIYFYLIP